MDYKNIVFTKFLNELEYKTEFDRIMEILKQNNIQEVEMLFGWAWANEYKNWISFRVMVENISTEIDKPQKLNLGHFGEDDVFITVKELEIELTFCHETDIHLSYNNVNKIVSSILDTWEIKEFTHTKRTN